MMESQPNKTVRYPAHLKSKAPAINLPLYHTDKSILTFYFLEETPNQVRKTAICKSCKKGVEFIFGSFTHSSYTLSLKFHLQSHPEEFESYLDLLAKNMEPDTKSKYQHFCRMEYPPSLPTAEKDRRWDENALHRNFIPINLVGEAYEKNDYLSKQNFKQSLNSRVVDGENVNMIEYIYLFTNRNVPLYELVGTWNVNNRLDRRYLRYKAFLQNTQNLTLDLERLLCENTCFLDPEYYDSCPNNHAGDISIFGDRAFQQKIKNLDDELEKYPEFINNKSFNSQILKSVRCIQKDSEALIEMNRLLKIILSMLTVKKDCIKELIVEIIERNTSDDRLVKPYFAIQLWGPKFVEFDERKNKNTKDFPEHLYYTYQHVDDRECPAYHDDSKIILKEPTVDSHENAIYPCNVGGCRKQCDCVHCTFFSGDEITECRDHYPDHPDNFNDDEDIVIKKFIFFKENKSIQYERPYQDSFWRPKDLRLPGMKKNCSICQQIVLDHSKNHHSFKIHADLCQICAYIELISENSMVLTCSGCKKKFESIYRLKDHMDKYSENNKFSCEHCSMKFPTNFTKERHITEIHTERQGEYHCDQCGSKFSFERGFQKHREGCHSETAQYSCNFCDSKFKRIDHLNRHLKEIHSVDKKRVIFRGINDYEEQFRCQHCDDVFKRKFLLERHIKTVHAESNPKFECSLCHETFNRKDNLRRHINKMHNETASEAFACNMCDERFSRKDNLKRHVDSSHMKGNE